MIGAWKSLLIGSTTALFIVYIFQKIVYVLTSGFEASITRFLATNFSTSPEILQIMLFSLLRLEIIICFFVASLIFSLCTSAFNQGIIFVVSSLIAYLIILFFVGNSAIVGISAELLTYISILIVTSLWGLCSGAIVRKKFVISNR